MAYDSRCEHLAQVFLEDELRSDDSDAEALAQAIQDRIEDFLNYELPDRIARRAGNSGAAWFTQSRLSV